MKAPKLARHAERGRLVYYRGAADVSFWERHWASQVTGGLYAAARRGELGRFEKVLLWSLPHEGRILEAGCGLGNLVVALRTRGYDAEGVDWDPETIAAVRERFPDLPVRVADVTNLDVPDGYYSAYVSLGVMEHRWGGPEPLLRETHRVLEPGGVAFISVPYFHALRQLKARLGLYRGSGSEQTFYQYAFTRREVEELLRAARLRVVKTVAYDACKGIRDEIPLRWLFRLRGIGWRFEQWFRSAPWLDHVFGHMILFVCRKGGAQ